jgi:hypothetical protein
MKRTLEQKINYCFNAARRNWDNPDGERWFNVYEYFRKKKALYNQIN